MTEEEFAEALIERHTLRVYQKLRNSRAAIAGLGGLGSNVAMMLSRMGIGELFIVDYDRVEISNLNRQHYFPKHVGKKKTDALEEQLLEINPYIKVLKCDMKVTEKNALELFGEYLILCEAFDKADSKAMLVNTILKNTDKVKIVAASGMAGIGKSNLIRTEKKMKNLYVCGDMISGISEVSRLAAPRVMICAAHQANMIVELLLNMDKDIK